MTRSIGALLTSVACASSPTGTPPDLTGEWAGQRIFGPALEGPIVIHTRDDQMWAQVGPYQAHVDIEAKQATFRLPNGARFEGTLMGESLAGFWLQQRSRLDGNVFATPVRFRRIAVGTWRGDIHPIRDTGTLRILVAPSAAGGFRATMINPERNLGVFQAVTRVAVKDDALELWGKNRGRGDERVLLRGRYWPDEEVMSIRYPWRGGGYDLRKRTPMKSASEIDLVPPPQLDDGWPTGRPDDVGIDASAIEALVKALRAPSTSARDLRVHALLIARRGRLVVEEYFRDVHREHRHDSRSASKTIAAVLAAAAMHSGYPLTWDTPVYPLFGRHDDPRRLKITLTHVAHMASGLDCNDSDPDSPANEDRMWDQAQDVDFYEHLLETDVRHPPGEVAAYCSAGSNLLAGAVAAAAKEPLLPLLNRIVMTPLGIESYGVVVPPDGHPYFGGGVRLRARDFLKFPQMLLNGGTWNARRLISEDDARRLTTPAVKIGSTDYGWQVWTLDYPYRNRTVRAHFMAGNGGQISMLIPELSLAIAFNAGNYSDRVKQRIERELVPKVILPAVTPEDLRPVQSDPVRPE